MRKRGRRQMKTPEHIRILLADTIYALEKAGGLDNAETSKIIIHAARVLNEVVRGEEMEARIKKLEAALTEMSNTRTDDPESEFFRAVGIGIATTTPVSPSGRLIA